jgi:hypothetical protein
MLKDKSQTFGKPLQAKLAAWYLKLSDTGDDRVRKDALRLCMFDNEYKTMAITEPLPLDKDGKLDLEECKRYYDENYYEVARTWYKDFEQVVPPKVTLEILKK